MKKRIGLIDFGSNTFHIIIADMTKERWEILFHQRDYVFLAQAGISTIADEALDRGMEAVAEFHDICHQYEVDEIIAVGTAALRSAKNSSAFTTVIREQFDIRTQIIDGQREADLIYKGMILACPSHKQDALFMDIGGGSTEFILTDHENIVFQQSYPIGLGVLKNKIPFSDPILPEEINRLNQFLDQKADSLIKQLRKHPPRTLIGGSGTFDVLAEALTKETFESQNCSVIAPAQVRQFMTPRIQTTLAERLQDEYIPDERIYLIIHAFLLILWVLDRTSVESVAFSKFALKEGLLQECFEDWVGFRS